MDVTHSVGFFKMGMLTLAGVLCLAVPVSVRATDSPVSVELNVSGEYYGVVMFDHAMHEEVGDCDACHHHATGGGTNDSNCIECHEDSPQAATVACRDCHVQQPFSATALQIKSDKTHQYHVDTPGLKGAFHRNCLGCHEPQNGPVGCGDCHERTGRGDDFYAGTLGDE